MDHAREKTTLFLMIVLITASCAPQVMVKYACIDGQVSDDKTLCDRISQRETERLTRFVCADGTITPKPDECAQPIPETLTKTWYVCPDNSTTEYRDGCSIQIRAPTITKPTEKPTDTKPAETYTDPILVLQSEGRQVMRDKTLKDAVYGEILNNGTKRCMAKVTVRIYTSGMKFIGQEDAIATPFYLNPKQKGSFDIAWDPLDHKGYQKYEISTECSTI